MSAPVRTNCHPFQVVQYNQPATRQLADNLREWCHWTFSVGLCCWQIGHSIVAVASQPWWVEIYAVEHTYNLHSCHHNHLFMGPVGDNRGCQRNRLTGIHITGHPIYLFIKILLCWGHPLLNTHGIQVCSYCCPFREIYPHTSSPNLSPIFQSCSFQVPARL